MQIDIGENQRLFLAVESILHFREIYLLNKLKISCPYFPLLKLQYIYLMISNANELVQCLEKLINLPDWVMTGKAY